MGTFKDRFYKDIKEKADTQLSYEYQQAKAALSDELKHFFSGIDHEASVYYDQTVEPLLEEVKAIEKEWVYSVTFDEVCKLWREVVIGGIEPLDFMREDV